MGIVNGTTNFILTTMSEHNLSYTQALAEAQRLGFAERDPTADVGGHDAAAKAAILAGLAFRCDVVADEVPRQGIGDIDPVDIEFAGRLGYVVKLLAVAERFDHEPDRRRSQREAVSRTRDLGPGAPRHGPGHPSARGGAGVVQRRVRRRRGGRVSSCSMAGARAGCRPPRLF